MSYLDSGFSKLLSRSEQNSYQEESEDLSSFTTPTLSGANISGGKTTSINGRIIIDWENGTIITNDGANDRILIGYQQGGF